MGLFGPNKNDVEIEKIKAQEITKQNEQNLKHEREEREREREAERERLAAEREEAEAMRAYEEHISELNTQAAISENEAKKFITEKNNETKIKLAQIEKGKEIERLESNERLKQIEEDAATKRCEVAAHRDIEIQESEKQIKIKEAEVRENIWKEISGMFSEYLNYSESIFGKKIELLKDREESRRIKYLKALESARIEKDKLIEISKEVVGQEKINYLDKLDDIERSIRELQENDAREEELFRAELEVIDYQMRQGQEEQFKRIIPNKMTLLLDAEE